MTGTIVDHLVESPITFGSVCSGVEAVSVMRWIGERILVQHGEA